MLLAACGGGPAAVHPTPARVDPPPPAQESPSEAECDALIDHVIDVTVAAQPDLAPTDADKVTFRATLRDQIMPECRTMKRDTLTCAVAAPTVATFEACDQTSRSSSTSNTSVAPGGIAPPAAPRSP